MLSIVIPVCSGSHSLINTLASISSEKGDPVEVIVVSYPECDWVDDVVKPYPGVHSLRIDYASTIPPALGMHRNLGASESSGERILFLDSDCVPRPGCLKAHAKYGRDGVVVAGRVDDCDGAHCSIRRDSRFLHGHYRNTAQELKKKSYFPIPNPAPVWFSNASVPAWPFKEVGGFWERGTTRDNEDEEMAWRLQQYGCNLSIDFRAVVYKYMTPASHKRKHQRTQIIRDSISCGSLIRQGLYLPPEPEEEPSNPKPSRAFFLE